MMAVMGRLLLNEPLGWVGAAGCLISLTGATVISHPPFLFGGHSTWGPQRLLGTLCGIASPCFGAGTGYCIRRIQKQEPALVVALWFHTVTVGLLVWPLLAGWPQAAAMVEARDAGLLVGISCSSFCAQLLMTRAFQLLPAARAASLNFLGVVYSHALVSGVLAKHTICCHNGVLWCPEGLLYYSSGHVCCATPS
jgi:drug/metabolite transporter (DMT)-like permease